MYLNQLTIIGFTGQDADLHFTSNGTSVTTLSVATKESWKDAAGDWQSHTEWHRIRHPPGSRLKARRWRLGSYCALSSAMFRRVEVPLMLE